LGLEGIMLILLKVLRLAPPNQSRYHRSQHV
jgi:hypothetical protein